MERQTMPIPMNPIIGMNTSAENKGMEGNLLKQKSTKNESVDDVDSEEASTESHSVASNGGGGVCMEKVIGTNERRC